MDSAAAIMYSPSTIMFKAIGFDIDGTLYPSHRLYARMAGLALRHARLMRAFASARKELRQAAREDWYLKAPPEDREDFYRFQAHMVALRLQLPEDEVYLLIRDIIYVESDETFSRIKPFKGVSSCLAAIRDLGLKTGALSDFPTSRKLDLLGLKPYFDVDITSESYGFLKPAAVSFLALSEELGVAPDEMLYVGNSYPYDIIGARAAGMKTAMITTFRHGLADFEFRHYSDLVAFIERCLASPR